MARRTDLVAKIDRGQRLTLLHVFGTPSTRTTNRYNDLENVRRRLEWSVFLEGGSGRCCVFMVVGAAEARHHLRPYIVHPSNERAWHT